MALEKTFEVKKNGYRLFIIEDSESSYKSLEIKQDNDDLPYLQLGKPSQMHSVLKDNSFEELEITIGTRSMGSRSVESIKTMIMQYEQAIETVEYFKSELMKLKQ